MGHGIEASGKIRKMAIWGPKLIQIDQFDVENHQKNPGKSLL